MEEALTSIFPAPVVKHELIIYLPRIPEQDIRWSSVPIGRMVVPGQTTVANLRVKIWNFWAKQNLNAIIRLYSTLSQGNIRKSSRGICWAFGSFPSAHSKQGMDGEEDRMSSCSRRWYPSSRNHRRCNIVIIVGLQLCNSYLRRRFLTRYWWKFSQNRNHKKKLIIEKQPSYWYKFLFAWLLPAEICKFLGVQIFHRN